MCLTRFVTLTLATVLLAAAPAAAQSVLRIGLNDDPDALDPTISRAYTGRLVFAALCDKLFDVTPDLKIVPQLATGFEWAADQRSVVIKLRSGVKFHDGEPFNAEAVKFNIERHINTPGSFRKTEIGQIAKVDVLDETTVRLNLSEPLVPLLAALTDRAGMMVSPKAAKAMGDKFGTRPVCAGPYKFVERVAQGKIVVERFPDYWDKGNIHIDRVEFVPILDSTARLASLRSGDLHMIERASPTDLAEIRGDSRLKVVGVPELGYQMIPMNVNNGPKSKALADVRVRQAIDLAIDRETLVKAVFNNEYIPGNQWISPASPYYNAKFPVRKRDVAKARQLLKDAGQPNPTFTLIVPPERDRQEAAQIIQAMLAEAGITMNIQTQENVTMLTNGRKGDFEAYFTFWSGRPDPDGNVFTQSTCNGAQNDSHYCNPAMDALLTKARQTPDPAERKKLYDQATEHLIRDVPRLQLWHRRVFTGYSARVTGFAPYPDGIIRLRGLKLKLMPLAVFVARRVAVLIPTLFFVSVLIFSLQKLLPGDAAIALAGEESDPAALAGIRAKYHLDQPAVVQYGIWMGKLLRGDLGESLRNRIPVAELLASKLPVTVELAVCSMLVALLIGIPTGVLSAVRRGTAFDVAANAVALSGLSVPHFWLGIMLILLFAVRLGWLPASGYVPPWEDLGRNLTTILMPSFVLGTGVAGVMMRHTRGAMLQVLSTDYVRTARAKSVPERLVLVKHALRNALIPVITLGAIEFGRLLSGAVLTEQIFSIPGFGKMLVDGVFNRDYAVVQGVVLVSAGLYVFLNLLADILYFLANPRLRGA